MPTPTEILLTQLGCYATVVILLTSLITMPLWLPVAIGKFYDWGQDVDYQPKESEEQM